MSKAKIYDTDFGIRVKTIVDTQFENNISKFSRTIGVAITSVNRWMSGEADPSRTNLIKIAKVANVSIQWLATGVDDEVGKNLQASAIEVTKVNSIDFMSASGIVDTNQIQIPIYRAYASAGHGAFAHEPLSADDYLGVSSQWLKQRGLQRNKVVIIMAIGDSMQPTIKNMDMIIVNKQATEPKDGNIYVVRVDDQIWVKRIQGLIGGIRLISDNKEIYDPIDVIYHEGANIEILGQVVSVIHDVL